MKQLRLYAILLVGALMAEACGGGGGNDEDLPSPPPVENKTYTQSVSVKAQGGQQTLTLSSLNAAISTVNNSANWVLASPQSYTSGSPQLQLDVSENTEAESRRCDITIIAKSGDRVVLTVSQEAAEIKTGIDDYHDSTSGEPAYGRQR